MTQTATMPFIQRTRTVYDLGVTHDVLSDFHSQVRNDLDNVFLNSREFAISIRYTHLGSQTTVTYCGIFDDEAEGEQLGNTEFIITQPQVCINRYSMKQKPKKGDVLLIKGINYSVDDIEDDGTGELNLFLVRNKKVVN